MINYPFRNLVFEGGGVKGIAYVGALQVLDHHGILPQIQRVGGTSAGAINALLVGLGYTVEEISKILWSLNFNNFLDDSWGFVRDATRLVSEFGWYKGDFFREWVGKIIKEKTGNSEATFADIEALKGKEGYNFRSLYFMVTNLSTRYSEVMSAEHTPRTCVADAVRMSMSIPLFFAAKRSFRGDVYVDGGVLDNYPVKLFDRMKYVDDPANALRTDYYEKTNTVLAGRDRSISEYIFNRETLGFRLDTKEEISVFRDHAEPVHHKIESFFDYTLALINTLLEAQSSSHLHTDDWNRTIYIDTLGVGTTQFDLSNAMKSDLVKSGTEGITDYLKWYNGQTTVAK